jgi:hypothetical protein
VEGSTVRVGITNVKDLRYNDAGPIAWEFVLAPRLTPQAASVVVEMRDSPGVTYETRVGNWGSAARAAVQAQIEQEAATVVRGSSAHVRAVAFRQVPPVNERRYEVELQFTPFPGNSQAPTRTRTHAPVWKVAQCPATGSCTHACTHTHTQHEEPLTAAAQAFRLVDKINSKVIYIFYLFKFFIAKEAIFCLNYMYLLLWLLFLVWPVLIY